MIAGCAGGHDGERIVNKDPATVYAALDEGFSDVANQGNNGLAAERGQVTTVERIPGKSLDLNVTIDGKQAAHMHFGVEPAKGGTATRLTGDLDMDRAVIAESIRKHRGNVSTPMPPAFALRMAMARIVDDIGRKIEAGEGLGGSNSSLAMAANPGSDWEQVRDRYELERNQRRSTSPTASAAPMVNPDAAAQGYLNQ
jgi:hypothetical protein